MNKPRPKRRRGEPQSAAEPRGAAAMRGGLVARFAWPRWAALLNPREPWLIPAVVLVASRLILSRVIPFAAEDAYITFRYARNFAHGFGLVFNPGEKVFGFSSPVWTLWMAAAFKLGASPVLWARLTTVALELVTLLVVGALLRRHASRASAWCFTVFWVVWPYCGAVAMSCMENSAMVGLLALATAWSANRSRLSGPALAAVALLRPEGMIAAAVVATQASWRDRAVAVAIIVAGLAALASYFGSPIPQSLLAKSQIYGTPGPWVGRYWWDWLSPFILGHFSSVTETGHLFLLSVVFTPALVLGARALWAERTSPLLAFIGACLAVWLGYALLGVAFFWWYLAVPLAGFVALAAAGFPRLARGPALYVSAGLMVVGLWTVALQLYLGRAQNEYLGFAKVARFLYANAQPGQKVMLEPIGFVGFQDPLVVVDEVGLVSPQVARRRLEGPGWYADVAARERPDWLVVRLGVLEGRRAFAGVGAPFRNEAERDSLLERYRVAAAIDTISGDNRLMVLKRWR